MRRSGFTLIELIFVIVIIGILGAVAIPKFKNLKANAYVSNVVEAINDLNGSGGASSYLNATELNGIKYTDLNITDLYKFRGKDWNVSNGKIAYYRWDHPEFRAYFYYRNNGKVDIRIYCNNTSDFGQALAAKGYSCNTTYTIDLETQD